MSKPMQELLDLIEGMDEDTTNYRDVRRMKLLARTLAKTLEATE